VDLGSINEPLLVPSIIASSVGLTVHARDVIGSLVAFLQGKHILIVLDSCEHVIDGVASAAARIFAEVPEVQILATSRAPLEVDGEQIHRLQPLATPPDDEDVTPRAAMSFPAVQLFLERAAASGARLELTDEDAPIISRLCRTLDGMPLAIELAAGRVDVFGLSGLATVLDSRLVQQIRGRRTALPRHQTLGATLDWSHDLLTQEERVLARRLSVFVGHFGLDAAIAVASFSGLDAADVVNGLSSLVSKSLVSAEVENGPPRYRFLETTRSYLRAKLLDPMRPSQSQGGTPNTAVSFSLNMRVCLRRIGRVSP
jgi:predicted ATPase